MVNKIDPKELDELAEFSKRNLEMPEEIPYPRSVIIGVLVLSVLALFFIYWQMKSRMIIPFPENPQEEFQITAKVFEQSLLDLSNEELKNKDSDLDGLSDYAELNVYSSSPFIADTDSDGISDFDEIKNGTNPNCPEGKNCFTLENNLLDTKTPFEQLAQSEDLQSLISNPAQLRVLLIKNGADPAIIQAVDDQTLQILATEAVSGYTRPTQEKFDILSKVKPDELRQYLISQGMTEEELNKISDEELQTIYNQALSEEQDQFTANSSQN